MGRGECKYMTEIFTEHALMTCFKQDKRSDIAVSLPSLPAHLPSHSRLQLIFHYYTLREGGIHSITWYEHRQLTDPKWGIWVVRGRYAKNLFVKLPGFFSERH